MLIAFWRCIIAARLTSRRCSTRIFRRRCKLLWLAFFASFAVKMRCGRCTLVAGPHVEARRGLGDPGAILLRWRLWLYSFLAACSRRLGRLRAAGLCAVVIAIIYTSLVALVQEDIKKLIAYSSVAHMAS